MKLNNDIINTDTMLNDILQKHEKIALKDKGVPDFLDDLKKNAFTKFAENLIKMDRSHILKEFENRLKVYNSEAKVYIDKKTKEK